MRYRNPVIPGFHPDPSVCRVGNMYYLACSSFRYSPGVPLFESDDLVNWRPIGHCLTRLSQLDLTENPERPGIFAPTLRHHDGRWYMTTTDVGGIWNFIVSTDDIHGEWSDPIRVDQGGIDPSLLFEDGHTYFMSNGAGDDGTKGIALCEIDIETGTRLTPSRTIWMGTGGRFLEGPHLYRIGDWYYLLAAEGGTEYGHMVTLARSRSVWGPYEGYPGNPILTNRDLGGETLQGVGHGDLVDDGHGNWWMMHLGFRQIDPFSPYHHLGRETLLTPVTFSPDGWITAGDEAHPGAAALSIETDRLPEGLVQKPIDPVTFSGADWADGWNRLRTPSDDVYDSGDGWLKLTGTAVTLDTPGSPTFLGISQCDFQADISCMVTVAEGEAGLTLFMDDEHHYDLAVRRMGNATSVMRRTSVGDLKVVDTVAAFDGEPAAVRLRVEARADRYEFFAALPDGQEVRCGTNRAKYLSSEVAGGCFGTMIGLYAQSLSDECCTVPALFTDFMCRYED